MGGMAPMAGDGCMLGLESPSRNILSPVWLLTYVPPSAEYGMENVESVRNCQSGRRFGAFEML